MVRGLLCNRSPWWALFPMVDAAIQDSLVRAVRDQSNLVASQNLLLDMRDAEIKRLLGGAVRTSAAYTQEVARRVGLEDVRRQLEATARVHAQGLAETVALRNERNGFKLALAAIADGAAGATPSEIGGYAAAAIRDQAATRRARLAGMQSLIEKEGRP